MQNNNKLRQFSGDTTNILSDSDLESELVQQGAIQESLASSALYNTLSKTTTTATTALVDFVASQNPSTTFGVETNVDTMITAVNNAFASKSQTQTAINNLTTNLQNGTLVVANATEASNSNLVQNVDLSDESVATFGDYIISKKKLVWNGNFQIDISKNSKITTPVAFPINLSPNTKYQIDISIPTYGGTDAPFIQPSLGYISLFANTQGNNNANSLNIPLHLASDDALNNPHIVSSGILSINYDILDNPRSRCFINYIEPVLVNNSFVIITAIYKIVE